MDPGAMQPTSAQPTSMNCANVAKFSSVMLNAPMPDCQLWPPPT
jgi:hypothetical protein